jgi:hypothetical protein
MKPIIRCSDVIKPEKEGFFPKECCGSCHSEMEDGYLNSYDDYTQDERVDQEFCCVMEKIWLCMTDEERKTIIEKKLVDYERSIG